MKKFLTLFIALLFFLPSVVMAAGSSAVAVTTDTDRENGKKVITITWKGDSGTGAVPAVTFPVLGYVTLVVTNPGVPAPDLYDLTLTVDAVDIMGGILANRSATLTQQEVPIIGTRYVYGDMTCTLSNQATASAVGVIKIYIDRKAGPDYAGAIKIDNLATNGLSGVHNSLAYRVHEIETHFHSVERWYGTDGDSTMSVANNLAPWTLVADAAANTYGTEVQLSAASDVLDADMGITVVKFDLHRIMITESSVNDKNYMVQIWAGTGIFGAATLMTEIPYRTASNSAESQPIVCQMSRIAVATKLWARAKCETGGGTLSIIIGIHAYKG